MKRLAYILILLAIALPSFGQSRKAVLTLGTTEDWTIPDNPVGDDYIINTSKISRKFSKYLDRIRVEVGENYVEYIPIGYLKKIASTTKTDAKINGILENVDIEVYPIKAGIKENIILKNNNAPLKYKWTVNTNLSWEIQGNNVVFGDEFISHLFAFDADSNIVPITVVRNGNTLEVDIDDTGAVYPIILDPTVIWQHASGFGKDNFITNRVGRNTWNYGVNTSLTIRGDIGGTLAPVRALIEFDSIETVIPNTSVIDSATLRLYIVSINVPNDTIYIYPLTRAWTEGTANGTPGVSNYDTASTGVDWTRPGGDFDSLTASADTLSIIGKAATDTIEFDVTALVQDIVDQTRDNDGWIIKQINELLISYVLEVGSSDNATQRHRPKLTVHYSAAPTPSVTGNVVTQSRGNVLHEARGYGLAKYRGINLKYPGKARKKGGS